MNQNVLFKTDVIKRAFTKCRLNNNEEFTYGYGWHLKDLNGAATREYGGSIFGFKSTAVYIPEKDIYVVGLSNCDCISTTQLTRDIAAVAYKNLTGKQSQ